jgi:hypothetical protein
MLAPPRHGSQLRQTVTPVLSDHRLEGKSRRTLGSRIGDFNPHALTDT